MTVAIISSRYPHGGEAFLGTELRGLRAHFERVVVIPARSGAFAPRTLAVAVALFLRRPVPALRALGSLLLARSPARIKLKNALLFPRALFVADAVRREGVRHIHAYWLSGPATVAMIASRLTGVTWSASAHRWDIYERNLTARKIESAAFVRTISKQGLEQLAQIAGGRYRPKMRCVRLGVEIPADYSGAPARAAFVLVCAANLVPVKGHATLLRALKIVEQGGVAFRCDIVGDGPLRTRLRRQIAALGLQGKAQLLGRRAHARLLAGLRKGEYDAAVLASDQRGEEMEGVPVALMEAMAAAVPCIATRSGAVGELLDQTCGIVVDAGDERAIADAITQLARSYALRRELGMRGRARVQSEFNFAHTTTALANLIAAASGYPMRNTA